MKKSQPKNLPDSYLKECSKRLETLIEDSNYKQYELADKLPFGIAMVSHYATGRKALNVEALIEFCNALQCQPFEIDPEKRIYKLDIKSRRNIDALLDSLPADKIDLIEQLIRVIKK